MLLIAVPILLVIAIILLGASLTRRTPQSLLADAREKVLNSPGWSFMEKINCSDGYALIAGNVSIVTNELSTIITVVPRGAAPRIYLFYSNKSLSMVNVEGGWIISGSGWKPQDTLLGKVLEAAGKAREFYIKQERSLATILFNGTCTVECQNVFSEATGIISSNFKTPRIWSGEVAVTGDGYPTSLLVVFKGDEGYCSLEYRIIKVGVPSSIVRP